MTLVARTFCLLIVALGLYLIGAATFTFDADVLRLSAGLLLAGVGYRIWARRRARPRDQRIL